MQCRVVHVCVCVCASWGYSTSLHNVLNFNMQRPPLFIFIHILCDAGQIKICENNVQTFALIKKLREYEGYARVCVCERGGCVWERERGK